MRALLKFISDLFKSIATPSAHKYDQPCSRFVRRFR
jgi:hypothetical protein